MAGAGKEDGAKLKLGTKIGNDNQKFKLINAGGDVYVIQCVHSGKLWTSSGKKGAVLTQSTSAPDDNAYAFRVIKQAIGLWIAPGFIQAFQMPGWKMEPISYLGQKLQMKARHLFWKG